MKHSMLATVLLAAAAAQAHDAPKIDPQRLSQDVKILASDEFEGRGPNTAGEEKTVAFIAKQFEAAGLKPGGDLVKGKRSWFQEVPLGRFEIQGPVVLNAHAGKDTLPFAQGEQLAVRAAMNGAQSVFSRKEENHSHENGGGCGSGDTTQRDELLAKIAAKKEN